MTPSRRREPGLFAITHTPSQRKVREHGIICNMENLDEKINKKNRVLIIIPAYNEQETIVEVAQSVSRAGYDYVIVNDGSTDATLSLCEKRGLNVVTLPQNLGIGGGVQTGHKYALERGYAIDVQFDGDGQHDVACIEDLINAIDRGADLAIGSRFLTDDENFRSTRLRRVGILWLSTWIRLFTGRAVSDPTSGFRACSRSAIELFCKSYPIDYPEPESIVYALRSGLSVEDVSVTMHARQGGTSSIGGLSSLYYMIKVTLAISIARFSKPKHHERDEDTC